MKTVEDKNLILSGSDSKIRLTIITNVYPRRPEINSLARLLQRNEDHTAIKILVSHQPTPSVVEYARQHRYDLMLAGHTHGGQIVFKPFRIPISAAHFDTPYYSGFYELGDLLLSVTNGLGLTLVPLRYQAPAEVTLLTLRREE